MNKRRTKKALAKFYAGRGLTARERRAVDQAHRRLSRLILELPSWLDEAFGQLGAWIRRWRKALDERMGVTREPGKVLPSKAWPPPPDSECARPMGSLAREDEHREKHA